MPVKLSETTPLTVQQKKFVRNYASSGKVHESALRAGFADGHYGTQLLREQKVREAVLMAMEKAGITDDLLMTKLREGLDAVTPTRLDSRTGRVTQKSQPDFFTRKHYLECGLKIRGAYPKDNVQQDNRTFNIVIGDAAIKGLLDTGAVTLQDFVEGEVVR